MEEKGNEWGKYIACMLVVGGYTEAGEGMEMVGWQVCSNACKGLLADPLLGSLVCELTVCVTGRGLPSLPDKGGVSLCGLHCVLSVVRHDRYDVLRRLSC